LLADSTTKHNVTLTPTLLGIAALLTAMCGIVSTILALKKSRSEEEEALREHLEESRTHEEELASELHALKMEHPELFPPEEPKPQVEQHED